MGTIIRGIGKSAKGFRAGSSDVKKMYIGDTLIYSLPYDAEIEYLESTGTQYIDTGIVPKDWMKFNLEFQPLSSSNYNVYFGTEDGDNYRTNILVRRLETNQTINVWFAATSPDSNVYSVNTDGFNNISLFSGGCIVNGVLNQFTSGKVKATSTVYLFAANNNNSVFRQSTCRIKAFQVWSDDELILDLIPVRVGQIGYMFDKVSVQLLGNEGTGDFVLGQDV